MIRRGHPLQKLASRVPKLECEARIFFCCELGPISANASLQFLPQKMLSVFIIVLLVVACYQVESSLVRPVLVNVFLRLSSFTQWFEMFSWQRETLGSKGAAEAEKVGEPYREMDETCWLDFIFLSLLWLLPWCLESVWFLLSLSGASRLTVACTCLDTHKFIFILEQAVKPSSWRVWQHSGGSRGKDGEGSASSLKEQIVRLHFLSCLLFEK